MSYVDIGMALSFVSLVILQAVAQGREFGFDIMDATGLPSGTVYPALRRLESEALVVSSWESAEQARKAGRPVRRNYKVSRAGRAALADNEARARSLSRLLTRPNRS